GTITVNATDGIATVSIGGTAYTLADLNGKFVNTGKGVLTITGVTPAADGKSAEIDYSYTLSAAQTHVAGNGDNTLTGTLTDTIAVAVAGVGGSTGSGNVTITIVDDVPVAASHIAGSVTEDGTALVNGNVTTATGNGFGQDGAAT
ncbi:hypothetical protein, partial [Comamonas jiangduensis]|uniref:hypothetical protein n=1 Tax=Comamonas jiangduensis TaxID=1194168 RepID=UPI0024E0E497